MFWWNVNYQFSFILFSDQRSSKSSFSVIHVVGLFAFSHVLRFVPFIKLLDDQNKLCFSSSNVILTY